MSAAEFVVFASISVSVLCWAVGEGMRSRGAWMAGALLALTHSIAAFAAFYQWSHATAERLTTEQAVRLTGATFTGGIYVNYLFLAVWLGDAAWWSIRPAAYETRPRAVSFAIRAFIFVIVVNGAIVFADGMARAVGIAGVAFVILARVRERTQRRSP
jgi:hypothetical protein